MSRKKSVIKILKLRKIRYVCLNQPVLYRLTKALFSDKLELLSQEDGIFLGVLHYLVCFY